MIYLTDGKRHLICVPYSIENLHRMADELGIARHWFHSHSKHPHYDIPKKRKDEIEAECKFISSKQLLQIIELHQMQSR